MRVVISGIVLAILLFVGFLVVKRLPAIQAYRDCYQLAYQVLDDKHLFVRESYISDSALCDKRKIILINSAVCFQDATASQELAESEVPIIDQAAQWLARGNKPVDELVDAHNASCEDIRQHVRYDPITDRWF